MGTRGKHNTKWLTNVFPRLSDIRDWCMKGKINFNLRLSLILENCL